MMENATSMMHAGGIALGHCLKSSGLVLRQRWQRATARVAPTFATGTYDQFIMAENAYRPQMQVCDMVVDTTGAAIWAMPEFAQILSAG